MQARAALLAHSGGELGSLANANALRGLGNDATQALLRLCAYYLGHCSTTPGGDAVARFHLDNGARLERLNALGDLSAKGAKQSFGLMVNYLYDLEKIEAHHEQFIQGTVAQSRAIAALL